MSLKERAAKVVSPVLAMYTDLEIECGRGMYIITSNGDKYLDFSSGIAVVNTGHCHPKVVEAIKKQSGELIHACIGIGYYASYIEVCEKLKDISPTGLDVSFLCQSGTEAVEGALKLAKYVTGKQGIIAFKGGFHGRSLGALSVTTSKEKFRKPYEPLLPNVYIAPYAYCHRCTLVKQGDNFAPKCKYECLKQTENIIKKAGAKKIAAMIVEAIQGENGYVIPPKAFISGLRKLCDKYKILMIADEVQTGFGRTGKMFAIEHFNVVPDIMTMSKAIASGMPLGAVIAKKEIMSKWSPGSHGGTLGGNPVACKACIATIEVLQKEKLVQNADKLSKFLNGKLKNLAAHYDELISDVRSIGLAAAVEFRDSQNVSKVLKLCLDHKLILMSGGEFGQSVRFAPPLIVTKSQLDTAMILFESALRSL